MKKSLLLVSVLAALTMGTNAIADDDDCYVPMSKWQSRAAVHSMAEAQGWNLRRIKIDDGCYEIKGTDASGREIEAKLDPATLAVIEMEYEGRAHNENREDEDDEDGSARNNAAPTPSSPPDNGLFTPGSKPKVITR